MKCFSDKIASPSDSTVQDLRFDAFGVFFLDIKIQAEIMTVY